MENVGRRIFAAIPCVVALSWSIRASKLIQWGGVDTIIKKHKEPTSAPPTLLQWFRTLGPAGGGYLSGATLNIYNRQSPSPLSVFDTTAGANFPDITVGAPGAPTGKLPAIVNVFAISGPATSTEIDPDTNAPYGFWIPMGDGTSNWPYDWLTLARNAQARGCIVDLVILFSNPAGDGNSPWDDNGLGTVLTPGSMIQNWFLANLQDLVPSLKQLTRPFIISPPGELNLTGAGGNYHIGGNWMQSNVATSEQATALFQLVVGYLKSQGVTNVLYNWEVNFGVGDYMFGCPGDDYYDTVSADWAPTNVFDPTGYAALLATGKPLFGGSVIPPVGAPGTYDQGLGYVLANYPAMFGSVLWCQDNAMNLYPWAAQALAAPWLSVDDIRQDIMVAGGISGG